MKKYAIWNKMDTVYTPSGEAFTAAEWIERYPIAALDSVNVVCAAGEMNGAYFGTMDQIKRILIDTGVDYSACTTDEEILEVYEAYETAMNEEAANYVSSEERIAAALEAQNLMAMEDVTE